LRKKPNDFTPQRISEGVENGFRLGVRRWHS
jgi:hypothetical protein